jgi:hypothetical protein
VQKIREQLKMNGGRIMVKLTPAAISEIKREIQDILEEGKKPLIRLAMSIG